MDTPPLLSLVLFALYVSLAFAGRALLQKLVTGDSGLRGISSAAGPAELGAGLLLALALGLVPAGAAAEQAGLVQPLLRLAALPALGASVALAGIAATSLAQLAMGRAWRIGVRRDERTQLMTSGPFAWVRNPIYSAMLLACAGFALITPNALSIAALAALLAALQLQVRWVEEPHLDALHGERYAEYCRNVGRFVPRLGKRAPTHRKRSLS